jgi:MFS family permease
MLRITRAPTGGRLHTVARLYLAHKFFSALYFVYPIFYEYATQAITPVQVGLFFSTVSLCGFVADIPTGIIADKRSRKFSALAGMILLTIAPVIIFWGHTFPAYLVAAVFYGLGGAFMNGALDALVYDHKDISKETYRRVNAHEITFGQAGILVSAAAGGMLFSISHGLPFIVQAMAGLICIFLIARMQELYKAEYVRPQSTHRKHFVEGMRYLFATAYLRIVVLMGVTFSVMLGMCIQFVHEAAMIEHGLDATKRGFLIAGAGATILIILNLFLLQVLRSDRARIIYMSGGAVVTYTLMSVGIMPLFLAGYLLWTCLNATSVFMRLLIQDQIPSSHRSTIMSSFKTLAVMIGLMGSTGTGLLVQRAGTPRAAYALFAVISCVILVPCALWLITHLRKLGYRST